MRRTVATLLISALLSVSAPSMLRRGDPGEFNPLRFLKKIVRLLIPLPTDGSDNLGPPKP